MSDRFGLQLQSLAPTSDRVLALGDLIRRRTDDGRFSTSDLKTAFYALNVPPPANVNAALSALRNSSKVIKHGDSRWALTPVGIQAASALALDAVPGVELAPTRAAGAQFAHTRHTVIPSWAAPPRWASGIARLLDRHPFDSNVLCMTRFPSEGNMPDPVHTAVQVAREVVAQAGLRLHLASDAIVEDDLLGNVGAYMWACRYGLGVVEDRINRGLNYNVVIELGGMTLTGRRCAILMDHTAPPLPTDLAGQIYKSVDLDDLAGVRTAIQCWVHDDLGLG